MTKQAIPKRWFGDDSPKLIQILTRARELEINLEEISKVNMCRFYLEELLTDPSQLSMRTKRILVMDGILMKVKTNNQSKKHKLTFRGIQLLEELSHEEAL